MAQPAPDVDEAWAEVSRRAGLLRRRQFARVLPCMLAAACVAGLCFLLWPKGSDDHAGRDVTVAQAPVAGPKVQKAIAVTSTGDKADTAVAQRAEARLTMKVSTSRGQSVKKILPDGTVVWLNANSSLAYEENAVERRVTLHGEAFFDVRHDSRTFLVSTDYFQATDLGTSFDINVYTPEQPSLVLVQGVVAVSHASNNVTLKPGQRVVASSGQLRVEQVDTYPYIQWKEGWFYFRDASLQLIMQEVSRWYGVNVVFENAASASIHLHFVASRKESLSEIVEKLNHFDGVNVDVDRNEVVVK